MAYSAGDVKWNSYGTRMELKWNRREHIGSAAIRMGRVILALLTASALTGIVALPAEAIGT